MAIDPTKWRAPWMDLVDPAFEFFFPEDIAEDTNRPLTPEELGPMIQELRDLGVSETQIENQIMIPLQNRGAGATEVRAAYEQLRATAEQQRTVDDTEAEFDAIRKSQHDNLNEYETNLGSTRQRYANLIESPGALRSDAEFGALLGVAENDISAAVDEELRRVGSDTAGAGLRRSGVADSRIRGTRLGGAQARGQAYNRAAGDVQRIVRDIEGRQELIPLMRSDIDAGRFGNTEFLTGLRLDTQPQFDPYEDFGFQLGTQEFDRGARNEGVGRGVSGFQAIGDEFDDFFDSIKK